MQYLLHWASLAIVPANMMLRLSLHRLQLDFRQRGFDIYIYECDDSTGVLFDWVAANIHQLHHLLVLNASPYIPFSVTLTHLFTFSLLILIPDGGPLDWVEANFLPLLPPAHQLPLRYVTITLHLLLPLILPWKDTGWRMRIAPYTNWGNCSCSTHWTGHGLGH